MIQDHLPLLNALVVALQTVPGLYIEYENNLDYTPSIWIDRDHGQSNDALMIGLERSGGLDIELMREDLPPIGSERDGALMVRGNRQGRGKFNVERLHYGYLDVHGTLGDYIGAMMSWKPLVTNQHLPLETRVAYIKDIIMTCGMAHLRGDAGSAFPQCNTCPYQLSCLSNKGPIL